MNKLRFKTGSRRYELFAPKGIKCITCGVEGNAFVVESYSDDVQPHSNLYHIDGDTKILMTKDRIIPKSKGGRNDLSNYNTMCFSMQREQVGVTQWKVRRQKIERFQKQ